MLLMHKIRQKVPMLYEFAPGALVGMHSLLKSQRFLQEGNKVASAVDDHFYFCMPRIDKKESELLKKKRFIFHHL